MKGSSQYNNKRKAGPQKQVYKHIDFRAASITEGTAGALVLVAKKTAAVEGECVGESDDLHPRKKRVTPSNSDTSAEAAMQLRREQ